MTEADKLLLEEYFADRLSAVDRTGVDRRVASDADFAAAFRERERMEQYLSYRAKGGVTSDLLAQLGQAAFAESTDSKPADPAPVPIVRRSLRTYLALAATVLLLILAGWWLWGSERQPDPQALYAAYAEGYPLSGTTMGSAPDSLRAIFEPLYNNREYAAALPSLNSFLNLRPEDGEVRLARGRALLETNQITAAEADFLQLAESNTAFREEGQWWYALAALKAGEPATAKDRLNEIPTSSSRYTKARELLGLL
jgi:tetratricopeptide (TPR) repeat protein